MAQDDENSFSLPETNIIRIREYNDYIAIPLPYRSITFFTKLIKQVFGSLHFKQTDLASKQ